MGKSKTRYPVDIVIEFDLVINGQYYETAQFELSVLSSPIRYQNIRPLYEQFVNSLDINYPTVMQYILNDDIIEINETFQMDFSYFMDEFGVKFIIIVQDKMKAFMDEVKQTFDWVITELDKIKQRLSDLPTKEELQNMRKSNLPVLQHNQSAVMQAQYSSSEQKKIDLGVLFSEPIFDEIRKRTAANPVDFRSQIQRLHTALKNSIKSEITLKCEIATKQNLKHLIQYSQPRILHIICHGTKQGALQFEDDSRTVVGTLQIVESDQIVQILRTVQKLLPDVVFINSCYSQTVGQKFFSMGVSYVIMIDSEDTIEDEAAQIFSQHFYRNIFSGEKVRDAFTKAQQCVKMKHNFSGCCCRHASKETHKPNCRWTEMITKNNIVDEKEKQEKHKLFHVPSQTCQCELKNLNRHKLACEWAKQSLFHINNDFRKIDEYGNVRFLRKDELPKYLPKDFLVVCCCFNYQGVQSTEFRMPHSESNKFKILQNVSKVHSQSVFSIVSSPYKQFFDYTSPQLVQTHQKIESSILGRQKQIYDFMKRIKDLNQAVYIVYGKVGVGRTSFALKSTTYLIERRIFEMYFYIDLYDIKDKDIFRYKFNQITKFNYNGDGQIMLKEVKNKMIIIILDNADDFFFSQENQLYEQLKNLKQQLHKTKIILTLKKQNFGDFNLQKVHCQKFELDILSIPVATRLIFTKMRHKFDVNVQFLQIDGLVRSNQALRIPKIIQSICQSFSLVKKKIKVADIKKKLQNFVEGDSVGAQLIQENLNMLKEKSKSSYELLLFISQFSEGITMGDFKMFSLYDKKQSKVHLPISKNWQSDFAVLFEKIQISQGDRQPNSSGKLEQAQLSTPVLKNMHSLAQSPISAQKQPNSIIQKIIKGESYFLEEVGQNRYIVKRLLRDFIWKKHMSQSNLYIKHLFVGYMAVMLEIYFKQLVTQRYLHQDLLEYSAISKSGLFADRTSIFEIPIDLTASVRFARQYQSQLEKIIGQHPSILDKIRKSDPSVFITNHKHDFLNIYQKKWDVVIKFLEQNKRNEVKICVGYLQNLMIFIPTAFKIAKVQQSLLKYVISKSMSLLDKLRQYSTQQKILMIQLKLQLMRASIQLQKTQLQTLRMDLDINKQFTIKLIKKIDRSTYEQIQKKWKYQKEFILMYKQYISKKQKTNMKGISYEKLKSMIENVSKWVLDKWDGADSILLAKRNLVVGLVFLNILKSASGVSVHAATTTTTIKFKKESEKIVFQMVKQSALIFKNNNLMKLCLKAKITAIELYSWQQNLKKKKKIGHSIEFYEQLSQKQYQIMQCERIYTDRKNNLIGFAQFQIQIKQLSKIFKQKLWEQSSNTLVCMKAVPITSNGNSPIIENLPRKKNNFRKEIQKVLNPQIDLCSKFQILTREKLKEQVENGCTILLLSANVNFQSNKTYLIFEGVNMQQDLVEINSAFVQQYNMKKIKILIIAGKNASLAINNLNKVMKDPPIMISLGKTQKEQQNKFKQFEEVVEDKIQSKNLLIMQQRRKAQVTFLKEFIKRLMQKQINYTQQVRRIVTSCSKQVMNLIEVDIVGLQHRNTIKIANIKGSYKDLSPGYQKNHNIDMKMKTGDSNFVCLRRWQQTYKVFKYLQRFAGQGQAAYINIFGQIGSGKSSFVEEIARILVERERFASGVYIIDGKVLEQKHQGQFQAYFNKESESGKIMTLEDFEIRSDDKLMLIIDDFHLIKPRSNGRFYIFLQKIIDRKVNLIIVTQEQEIFKRQAKKLLFKQIKPIRIQRLNSLEIDLVAYNTLDFTNEILLNEYLQMKANKESKNEIILVEDIMKLRKIQNNGMKKTSSHLIPQSSEMKKLLSYQI